MRTLRWLLATLRWALAAAIYLGMMVAGGAFFLGGSLGVAFGVLVWVLGMTTYGPDSFRLHRPRLRHYR